MRSEMETRVLAVASELASEPRLLDGWRNVIGDSAVRLVVYPDKVTFPPDPRLSGALVSSFTDSRPPIRATILTGPVNEAQHRMLLRDCAGFYGSAEIPAAVRGLTRFQIDDLASLLSPSRNDYEVTLIGDGYRMLHRESVADRGVLVQVFQLEEYSFEPLSPWLTRPHTDAMSGNGRLPLIVDCGANIGASVVYFAKMFPNARIIALEPELGNFSLLLENAAPFGDRVTVWDKAIASTPGVVKLTDPGLGEWGYRASADADGHLLSEVAAITIDDVVRSAPEATPFVLKVDIEGAEADLFAARGATLDLFPVVIVELHDWMYPGSRVSAPFLAWHERHGREMRTTGENFFSLSASLAS